MRPPRDRDYGNKRENNNNPAHRKNAPRLRSEDSRMRQYRAGIFGESCGGPGDGCDDRGGQQLSARRNPHVPPDRRRVARVRARSPGSLPFDAGLFCSEGTHL